MTWISLVCLLALSSSAFGRTLFSSPLGGGYGGAIALPQKIIAPAREIISRPAVAVASTGYGGIVSSGYGAPTEVITPVVQTETVVPKLLNNYDTTLVATGPKVLATGGYGSSRLLLEQGPSAQLLPTQTVVTQTQQLLPAQPVTEADLACRGQLPETVIPVDGGQRFFVCLDDGKGAEQFCQKGLIYNPIQKRCERRTGPFDSCASQPCLNGGACLNTEYSYQCQCVLGFDGNNCELDARICQTQNPCGLGIDSKCQSFRWGAALEYLCVYQNGDGYGPNSNQIHQSPCVGIDGPHALAFTNKGFTMCDGERAFYESCPGGTIWHDPSKACVWPDMIPLEIATPVITQRTLVAKTGYGGGYGGGYGETVAIEQPKLLEQVTPVVTGYGNQIIATGPKVLEQVTQIGSGYGNQIVAAAPRVLEQVTQIGSGYGGVAVATAPRVLQQVTPVATGYGGVAVATAPRVLQQVTPVATGYGGVAVATAPKVLVQSGPRFFDQPKVIGSYGGAREEILVNKGY